MHNPYVQIANRRTVDLLKPDLTDIPLESIAFALAHINRFTGHAGEYSVAEHSVAVARILYDRGYSRDVQRGGLLHDAHEALIGDVSTPVKWALERLGGREAFDRLDEIHKGEIERRFRVNVEHPAIKAADRDLLALEVEEVLGGRVGPDWPEDAGLRFTVGIWTPSEAMAAFLRAAQLLGLS